ncbi:MAG: hypothetical protein PHF33_10720 [Candidatus Delongbacteria bacterium]|nr:hypothetical protein [Candidatus Delongbacteria bacterium]
MKYPLFLFLASILSVYGQFSSSIDYSVKETVQKNMIGAGMILEAGEIEWKVGYGTGETFKAKSELFGAGYSIFGNSSFDKFTLDYQFDQIFRQFSSSGSTDSLESITNLDPSDMENTTLKLGAGLEYDDTYGIFLSYGIFTGDEEDVAVFGFDADYKLKMKEGKGLIFNFGMNFYDPDDCPADFYFLNEPDPEIKFGLGFERSGKFSNISLMLNYFSYGFDNDGLDDAYLNGELSYKYSFTKADSYLSASAGSNLASDFSVPKIKMPFFYYDIVFGNTLVKDRLDILVGWEYGLFSDDLRFRPEFAGTVPDDIISDEITEVSGNSRLYIQLAYRY